jgi:hypothetical protein
VALWAVLACPAGMLWGLPALLDSGVALVVCLVPAVITLVWSQFVQHGSPEQRLLAVLGGIGLRMAFVLGAGLLLALGTDAFHHFDFLLWLLIFYLATLGLETRVLVGSFRQQGGIKA